MSEKPTYEDLKQRVLELEKAVSDHNHAKEALADQNQLMAVLLENLKVGVFMVEAPSGKPLLANHAAKELLGRGIVNGSYKDNLAEVYKAYKLGTDDHYPVDQMPIFRGIQGLSHAVDDMVVVHPDGNKVLLEVFGSPVRDQQGNVIASLVSFSDITDRKQAEEDRKRLQAQVQQTQKMEAIGTLAGGIAHDFNNILSAIFGYTELILARTKAGSFVHERLINILKAAERARDLVKQILVFSRQGVQENMPVEIAHIVNEVTKFMRASLPSSVEIRQKNKNAPTVLGDPTEIHQVIMNLCTNAGQAMRAKGGILEVVLETMELDPEFTGRHPGLQPGAHIKLAVSDTGCGMPPQLVKRIFDPFFTTKDRDEGTGMGLSVVHGIVKKHGGIITVYSSPEKGSVFNVFLPAIERRSDQDVRPEKIPIRGTERILFVDDEETLVELGATMLGSLGYKVTGVTDSLEALERFKEDSDQYDLVITDLTMPKMTGDLLARELLNIRPDIPIILCTGFSTSIDEDAAKAMGIRAFANKPILMHHMSETVRKVLDSAKASV